MISFWCGSSVFSQLTIKGGGDKTTTSQRLRTDRVCPTFRHADNAGVGAHHQHCEMRNVSRQAKHGCLEIPLVTGEIDKGYNLVPSAG